MKHTHLLTLFVIFTLISVDCYSQQSKAEEKLRYETKLTTEYTTLNFKFENSSLQKVKDLKEELLTYDGKIITIDIDEINALISITKTEKLREKDLIEVIDKYEIGYKKLTPNKK